MRYTPPDSSLFAENRRRLAAKLQPNSLAVVVANDILPTNADGTKTNDFNTDEGRQPPEREAFVSAYVRFVDRIRGLYPQAVVLLTEGPLVSDEGKPGKLRTLLKSYIDDTVARVADPLIRHVPSNQYGGDKCDAHPTGAQHREMAKDFEPVFREALGW